MGKLFKVPGYVLYVVGGLWALGLSLNIVHDALGSVAMFISFFLLPVTLGIAPFYEGFAHGNWFPAILTYGSGIAATGLISIGTRIDRGK